IDVAPTQCQDLAAPHTGEGRSPNDQIKRSALEALQQSRQLDPVEHSTDRALRRGRHVCAISRVLMKETFSDSLFKTALELDVNMMPGARRNPVFYFQI